MNKILKSIVDGAINAEFIHVQDENLKDMKDLEEHEELTKRSIEIQNILFKHLPKEFHDLLNELCNNETEQLCLEIMYDFRKGVKAGLTDLKYLEEAKAEIIML